jgi:hypothetical protein
MSDYEHKQDAAYPTRILVRVRPEVYCPHRHGRHATLWRVYMWCDDERHAEDILHRLRSAAEAERVLA